ncbi:MAG TPA: 7-cyano-7-deazaguanine synthase [Nitrospiria bacterium]|nr:7-cyano-7-deazaguanine synthase [Nitrospiria bacterium]
MTKRPSVAVLVSGGLDSCVLAADLARRHRILPIYVRNGLRWETAEFYWLRRFLPAIPRARIAPLVVLDLPMQDVYQKHWSLKGRVPGRRSDDREVYLPGRNIILLTKAVLVCQQAGIKQIALAPLGHNPFPDSRPSFFKQMERTFAAGIRWRGRILTPYRALTKPQVIRKGVSLGLPLHLTFSCLQPQGRRPCGRCNKCEERRRAFLAVGPADAIRAGRGRRG